MDKAARLRWVILLTVAAITAAFSFYPESDDGAVLNPNRTGKHAEVARTKAAPATVEPQVIDSDDSLDPFAPRGWQLPPPPAPTPVAVAAVPAVPVAPPAPVGPPPLPYKFMGAMNDDGNIVIYLSRGDQALVARGGETLDGTYKVLAIDSQHIEFEHLPTGEKQSLSIPASEN